MNNLHIDRVLMGHIGDEGYHGVEDIHAIIEVMIGMGCTSWTKTDIAIAIYLHNN
jgi:hypothetical protein